VTKFAFVKMAIIIAIRTGSAISIRLYMFSQKVIALIFCRLPMYKCQY